jgi:hypothetical protein
MTEFLDLDLDRRTPARARMRPGDSDVLIEHWEHRLYAERDLALL